MPARDAGLNDLFDARGNGASTLRSRLLSALACADDRHPRRAVRGLALAGACASGAPRARALCGRCRRGARSASSRCSARRARARSSLTNVADGVPTTRSRASGRADVDQRGALGDVRPCWARLAARRWRGAVEVVAASSPLFVAAVARGFGGRLALRGRSLLSGVVVVVVSAISVWKLLRAQDIRSERAENPSHARTPVCTLEGGWLHQARDEEPENARGRGVRRSDGAERLCAPATAAGLVQLGAGRQHLRRLPDAVERLRRRPRARPRRRSACPARTAELHVQPDQALEQPRRGRLRSRGGASSAPRSVGSVGSTSARRRRPSRARRSPRAPP